MKFLCLLIGEPGVDTPEPGSAEFAQMLQDYKSATSAMAAAGMLIDSGPLQDPSTASTIRVRGGKARVTDGPFIEMKEVIGGYYVLDCQDTDEAMQWVATLPSARYGAVEVRPLMVMPGHN